MQISIRELKILVKDVLIEKRRQHSEDRYEEQYNNIIKVLHVYVDKGLFFHMTDNYNLQGLNVKTEFNTPIGIYTYPLNKEFLNYLLNNELLFAQNRKYIIVYKPRQEPLKVSEYTWKDFYRDAKILGYIPKKIKGNFEKDASPTRALFWCIYDGKFGANAFGDDDDDDDEEVSTKSNFVKANKNLRKLGYSGVYDDIGEGVIHKNEPTQAFFVGSDMLDIVDVVQNPTEMGNNLIKNVLHPTSRQEYDTRHEQDMSSWKLKNDKTLNNLSEKQILRMIKINADFISVIPNPTDKMWMTFIKYTVSPMDALQDIKNPTQDMKDYTKFRIKEKYSSASDEVLPNKNIKRIIQKYDL